jgi:hypothetical protein
MKTLAITLTAALIFIIDFANAGTKSTTYSHLPLELKESLLTEITNTPIVYENAFYGNVWVEFHLDGNHEIHVTALSSDNLNLGRFTEEVLQELPKMSEKLPIGKTYYVKIRISHI